MAFDRQRIYHKRDRLRQLRAFCYAAEFESITRSAEHLAISQPAVSLHVRELEHEVEALLFDRIGPRVALTPAGRRLHQLAMPLVQAMDRLGDTVTGKVDEPASGEIRVAAGPSAIALVLPPYFKRFRDEHPEVRVQVTGCAMNTGLNLLCARDVDLVFGGEMPETETFSFHPAFRDDIVLITPEAHPLAGRESVDIEEAAQYPAIVPPEGTYNRQFGDSIARRFGVEVNVAVEASGWRVIKRCVEDGLGISVVPRLCLTGNDRVWVIPFARYAESRSYGVFTRRGQTLSRPVRRLILTMAPDFRESS